jgi:hypothetical protein
MIKNGNVVLSQSITKELGLYVIDDQIEELEWCPKKLYHKFIANDYPDYKTDSMDAGIVAETLLLGGGAKGQSKESISTKKNGEKRVLQTRLEIQANRMYGYMFANGVRINKFNTQVPLIAKYSDNIWLRGEMDIFPVTVDGNISIVDFKSTKDIYSDFFTIVPPRVYACVNSCWGTPNKIAKNQPLFYHFLARNFESTGLDNLIKFSPENEEKYRNLFSLGYDYSECDFWYFIAGVGVKDLEGQLTKYQYSMNSHRGVLLDALVEVSISKIRHAIKTGFLPNKNEVLCKSCKMAKDCL